MLTAACTSPAILCMVLVQITTQSAPPRSSRRAAATMSSVAAAQSPAAWNASICAKSNDQSSSCAECSPPSRSRAIWFSSR